MAKFIIHAGMPKTGTSVLQHVVNRIANTDASTFSYFEKFKRGVAHHALATEVVSGLSSASLCDLLSEIKSTQDSRPIFVSSEGFSNGIGGRCKNLIKFFKAASAHRDVELVVVIRRLDSFIESMYSQQVRFGRYSGTIEGYARTRRRWMKNFFEGISFLKKKYPKSLNLVAYGKGFDSTKYFSEILGVSEADRQNALALAPRTERFSWKSQVVLNNVEMLCARLGFDCERKTLISILSDKEFSFSSDSFSYSFLTAENAQEIYDYSMKLARKYNISEYLSAFPSRDVPVYEHRLMDFSVLEDEDFDRLRDRLISCN